jgi:ABC-2 type transport system ATP-binding protein
MIDVKNVSKIFGTKKAVDNISFSVEKGDVLGFIGPNGAGKSTTMRMVTGFLPPSAGNISIAGINLADFPLEAKRKIGYLPENAPLYMNKTVREFLRFIAEIRGYAGKEKRTRVDEAIERCFLEPVARQKIETLSKGYKHRACFAQAVLHDPEVLILDEPTDGLDPNQKREVRRLIREMGETKAIIISTHILEEIEAVTTRVLLINNGGKVFDDTPKEFKKLSKKGSLDEVFAKLTLGDEAA